MADGSAKTVMVEIRQIATALNLTKRGAQKRADREDWSFTGRRMSGGLCRFYDPRLLPADVRNALDRQRAITAAQSTAFADGSKLGRRLQISASVDAAVQKRTRTAGLVGAAALTGKARERMDAKLELLARLSAFASTRGLKQCAAMAEFCDAYNSGALTVPLAVRRHTGADLHPATLRRWKHINKTQGAGALAGSYGNRRGSGKLGGNRAIVDFVTGVLADRPHISAKIIYEGLCARFDGAALPNVRSVERFLKQWKTDNAETLLAVANPDAWKNRYMSAHGSLTESITRANQLWMLDSTPADLQLVDGRYTLVGVIDLAWRGLRLHVAKTSTAEAVTQVMRRAILEWGVPEAVKMDNGRDYVSDRVAGMLTALQIDPRFSMPFAAWEKGNIERAFRTFSHSLLELLPGYTGHNVAEAQAIRARQSFADRLFKKNTVVEIKLTAAELQAFCDRWCNDYYAHEKHAGLDGATPFQRYAQLREVVNRIGDVRALDLLLGAGAMRRVTKKGLRIDNLVYIAPELASVVGQDVLVRQDDGDLGRVVVYHQERFLCVAECPEVSGVSRRDIAIEGKARQAAAIQQKKRELKALGRKANTADLARDILDKKARDHAALAALPAPNVVHLTPAIEAATYAADALDAFENGRKAPAQVDAELGPVTIHHVDEVVALRANEHEQDETSEQRFKRALDYLLIPEHQRNDIQRQFLRQHTTSAEFRGRMEVFEYFGPDAMGLNPDYAVLLPDGTDRDRLIQAQQGNPD